MTINQSPEKFADFKRSLRTYEGTMKVCEQSEADSVMFVRKKGGKCFGCGQTGHTKKNCPSKPKDESMKKKWCEYCRTATHNTNVCRKKPQQATRGSSAKTCTEGDSHKFTFKVSVDSNDDDEPTSPDEMSSINAIKKVKVKVLIY